jgi:hypothetical protein
MFALPSSSVWFIPMKPVLRAAVSVVSIFVCSMLTALAVAQEDPAAATAPAAVDYIRDVRPLLRAKCSMCHNEADAGGGLRLDAAAYMLKGGDSGVAIVAGKSAQSRLIQAVEQTGDLKMPPPEEGKPLEPAQIQILRNWIDQGAIVPEDEAQIQHWSYLKPVRPAVPANELPEADSATRAVNPIDAFLHREQRARGIQTLQPASKNVLLRRVYLDLIGLPPTPAQLAAFVADETPEAYEKVVDELLASPHYGERWGRHWMDVWRYSDWDGYGAEVRESKPHIWRWRDWIIESLNADKSYDQMIVEMLAADEAYPDKAEALRATGFLVRNWYLFNRNSWIDNTIEHTGKAFLGVTFNCARCHDHMYDPISQSEYYHLRALFEPHDVRTDRVPGQADIAKDGLVRVYDSNAAAQTLLFVRGDEKNPIKDKPLSPKTPAAFGRSELSIQPVELPASAYYPGLQPFVAEEALKGAEAELQAATSGLAAAKETDKDVALAESKLLVATASLEFTRARIAADQANYAKPSAVNAGELSLVAGQAERTLSLHRSQLKLLTAEQAAVTTRASLPAEGMPADALKTKAVTDAEAAIIAAKSELEAAQKAAAQPSESYTRFTTVYPTTSTGRRLAFAKWIASPENPLTARVAINHLWLRHFHQPLVPTVFDFGVNGKTPTHPELLDWLACELMENGWKMKPVHRLMVTSRAYQMASSAGSGETSLAASNLEKDPENRWLWRQNSYRMEAEIVRDATFHVSGQLDEAMYGPDLDPASGLTLARRSVYFRTSKEKKMTFLATFDSANPVECYQRAESISPQQSLAMSNSPLTLAQSRVLASKLSDSLRDQAAEEANGVFVEQAFQHVLLRMPNDAEKSECVRFLQQQAETFASGAALTAFTGGGENPSKPSADPQSRARENLVHVLFNHHDFVTVR